MYIRTCNDLMNAMRQYDREHPPELTSEDNLSFGLSRNHLPTHSSAFPLTTFHLSIHYKIAWPRYKPDPSDWHSANSHPPPQTNPPTSTLPEELLPKQQPPPQNQTLSSYPKSGTLLIPLQDLDLTQKSYPL